MDYFQTVYKGHQYLDKLMRSLNILEKPLDEFKNIEEEVKNIVSIKSSNPRGDKYQ